MSQSGVAPRQRVVAKLASRSEHRVRFGKRESDALVLRDRGAEGLSVLGVLPRLVKRGLRRANALQPDQRSAVAELAENITDELFNPLAPLLAAGAGYPKPENHELSELAPPLPSSGARHHPDPPLMPGLPGSQGHTCGPSAETLHYMEDPHVLRVSEPCLISTQCKVSKITFLRGGRPGRQRRRQHPRERRVP